MKGTEGGLESYFSISNEQMRRVIPFHHRGSSLIFFFFFGLLSPAIQTLHVAFADCQCDRLVSSHLSPMMAVTRRVRPPQMSAYWLGSLISKVILKYHFMSTRGSGISRTRFDWKLMECLSAGSGFGQRIRQFFRIQIKNAEPKKFNLEFCETFQNSEHEYQN